MNTKDTPWEGDNYCSCSGLFKFRLLIVGESVYSRTQDIVCAEGLINEVLDGAPKRWMQFYSKIYKLLTDQAKKTSSDDIKKRFWDSVAFTNYIPIPVADRPRKRPTREMWESAKEPFLAILNDLEPHGVLILGKTLWSKLVELKIIQPDTITRPIYQHNQGVNGANCSCVFSAIYTHHPSYPKFRSEDWRPSVEGFVDELDKT